MNHNFKSKNQNNNNNNFYNNQNHQIHNQNNNKYNNNNINNHYQNQNHYNNQNQENFELDDNDFKKDINDYDEQNNSANYLTFKNENEEKEKEAKKEKGTEKEKEKEPIYIMTIELEKERSDIIQIFNDSSPEDLAFEFCKKNNLNFKAMGYLVSEIDKLVNKFTLYRKLNYFNLLYLFHFTLFIYQDASIQEEIDEESFKDKSSISNKMNNLKNSKSGN
jgi:hypothetical protein